jgi:hypothetical protein
MKQKNKPTVGLSAQELQIIEQLREHPELMERFQSILKLSANADGPVKSADGVEGILIEEMRRLGNVTIGDWALSAEKRLAGQLEQKDVTARARKKNAELVVCVRGGQRGGAGLAHERENLCALVAQRNWR